MCEKLTGLVAGLVGISRRNCLINCSFPGRRFLIFSPNPVSINIRPHFGKSLSVHDLKLEEMTNIINDKAEFGKILTFNTITQSSEAELP